MKRRQSGDDAVGEPADTTSPPVPRELLGGWLGYAASAVPIAFAVGSTVHVIVQGLNGGILLLIWIVFGGSAMIFLARRRAERSARQRDAG